MEQNVGLIIAIVGSCMTTVGVLFGVIFWTRGECNSLRSDANADRRDIVNLVISIKEEINAIHLEMKDFHHRLCEIKKNK